jgi:hypothetical protein
MNYLTAVRSLMINGKPDFELSAKAKPISYLVKEFGFGKVQKLVFLMIKDFCDSVNVVRNMTEDQMIEASAILIDEADNMRLEDYAVFFAGCKKGDYGIIRDRIDLQTIQSMLDDFWLYRHQVGIALRDKDVLDSDRQLTNEQGEVIPRERHKNKDQEIESGLNKLAGFMGEIKKHFKKY